MNAVWVVRDDLEEVQAAFPTEKAAANYTHGWVGDGLLSITRETLLTPAQAAVIEAAKAMVGVVHPPKIENYREYMAALDNLVAAVTALRALEGDA
jgi:hypothetical protein